MAIVVISIIDILPVRVQATVRPLLLAERQEEYERSVPTCPVCGLRELTMMDSGAYCECGWNNDPHSKRIGECPECGTELIDDETGYGMPVAIAACSNCGWATDR